MINLLALYPNETLGSNVFQQLHGQHTNKPTNTLDHSVKRLKKEDQTLMYCTLSETVYNKVASHQNASLWSSSHHVPEKGKLGKVDTPSSHTSL